MKKCYPACCGIWTFEGNSKGAAITYHWKIEATKPIFSANHFWEMRKGEECLKLEIRRRKDEKVVPKPPKPIFSHNLTGNKIL